VEHSQNRHTLDEILAITKQDVHPKWLLLLNLLLNLGCTQPGYRAHSKCVTSECEVCEGRIPTCQNKLNEKLYEPAKKKKNSKQIYNTTNGHLS